MKNISIVINIILAIAIGGLYYLHFKKDDCCKAPAMVMPAAGHNGSGIVWVNTDSLSNSYEFFKDSKKVLEEKRKRMSAEFESKYTALQNDAMAYQQKGAGMTPDQRAAAEQDLGKRQQSLMQRKEEMGQQLALEEEQLLKQVYEKINVYLKKANTNGAYQYVMAKNGGPMLMVNDSMDLTKQLVQGLNKEYKDTKKDDKK